MGQNRENPQQIRVCAVPRPWDKVGQAWDKAGRLGRERNKGRTTSTTGKGIPSDGGTKLKQGFKLRAAPREAQI